MLSRLCGVATPSNATVATWLQLPMPPPETVGLGAAALVLCPITATVTSAFAAGEMVAVVQTFWFTRLLPAVSRVRAILVGAAAGATGTGVSGASGGSVGRSSTQVIVAAAAATAA